MKTSLLKGGSKEPSRALSRTAETRCFRQARSEVANVFWFSLSKKNCLLSVALLSALPGAARAASQPLVVTLDNKPVTLTSRFDPNEGFVVDVTSSTDRFTVTHGNQAIEQDVLAHPDDLNYVPAVSSAVTAWNGYLLVEDDDGGNGWRADRAHIFDRYCDRTALLVADLGRARTLLPPSEYTVLAGLVRHMTVGKLPTW